MATSTLNRSYLILYNVVSALAWLVVLVQTIRTILTAGYPLTYLVVGQWTKWTLTAASLEILHSLFGLIRAPLFTTFVQVFTRAVIVWFIIEPFPYLAVSPFYTAMLLAWSTAEVIRYSYFALSLSGWNPRFLTWLRYNCFLALYPVGITSEWALVYLALGPAGKIGDVNQYTLYAILVAYVPGAYTLYTYMMKTRRRVMANLKAQDEQASK